MGEIFETWEKGPTVEDLEHNGGALSSPYLKLLLAWMAMGAVWLFLVSFAVPAWRSYRKVGFRGPDPTKTLSHILGAQYIYRERIGGGRFGTLKQLRAAGYLKEEFHDGELNGYHFQLGFESPKRLRFWIKASPLKPEKEGDLQFYFFTNDGGTILKSASDFTVLPRTCSTGPDFINFGRHVAAMMKKNGSVH